MENKISAVIVDTHPDKQLAILAIENTLKFHKIKKVYTVSDAPYYQGAEFFKIPTITSIKEYEYWVLGGILDICSEDVLIIQWDGFVLHPHNWRSEYFNYDYIGAPHDFGLGYVVGNGGFSFRSQKLLLELRELIQKSNAIENDPEDIYIGKNYPALAKKGIKFAPLEIAETFSYQDGLIKNSNQLFGFHSPWNFPHFFHENSLIPVAEKIISRISNFRVLTMYLGNIRLNNMHDLFFQSINAIESNPNLIKIIDRALGTPGDKFHALYAPQFIEIMGG
jgi:hypothetical protein